MSLSAPSGSETLRTVVLLALAPAISLGFARFAYALVLPDMQGDLGWSYAEAGMMNTTNAAGYLLGALLASRIVAKAGEYRTMMAGVAACIAALAISALFRDTVALNLARVLSGFGGGIAFVSAGVLATAAAQQEPSRSSFLIGIFYAGPGFGILVSGVVIPMLLDRLGAGSWPWAWAALAALSMVMALGLLRVPHGPRVSGDSGQGPADLAPMRWLLAGYFLFGAGYIAYMTFMLAWVRESGGGPSVQAAFWATTGMAAMASPWLSARVLQHLHHGFAFGLLALVTAGGAVLPLVTDARPMVFVSAGIFGASFFSVVAATTVFVRRNHSREAWAKAIGALTVSFGVGQTIGPLATGFLNDLRADLSFGLWVSSALLLLASLIGAAQRDFGAERHDGGRRR